MSRFADFRSDTVTRPTSRMLEAMASAKVGDDVLGDDPTVAALERRFADLFGKDAALFMPSGTMANQCAVAAHIVPGEEVIVEANAHIFQYEGGGLARIAGAHVNMILGERGMLPLPDLAHSFRPPSVHMPRTGLVCVEQTHLFSGGSILPIEYLEEVHSMAAHYSVAVHMDGARIFNAQAETSLDFQRYGAVCESMAVSLCKGLSCPVGSMLMGDGAFIERARHVRKWMGGGMRQAGYLAACGLVALDEVLPVISEDNARCRRLSLAALALEGIQMAQETTDTNILFLEVTDPRLDAPMIESELAEKGVQALALGPRLLRFVTHSGITDADVDHAVMALQTILSHN
ncbi:MAG: DegT/DnrJ/EryC1/StrS family aminotransferase [Planctomycetes bacterium]|nr:DegT/DnrJ/EryC1/StrS family aminotransferase [Planctomycetota bacterium]